MTALVGAAVLLVAVFSGGLAKAGGWVGERMVDVIAPRVPVEPSPSGPAKNRKQKRQQDSPREGRQSG